jgi:hypothetical protein
MSTPNEGHRPEQQQEPVHAPFRDAEAPRRSVQPVVWVGVALAVFAALAIALVVAAIRSA